MHLSNLSAGDIVLLIQGGYISNPNEIVAAHDAILQRIIFHNEIVDTEYFDKLTAVVTALRVSIYPSIIFFSCLNHVFNNAVSFRMLP